MDLILEKGLPALERILVNVTSRRGAAPPRRPAPPPSGAPAATVSHEPSSATVLETPADPDTPTAAPIVTDHGKVMRWNAAVDALARAIEDGVDPTDFADTLDHLLRPEEIDLMLIGGPDAVMAQVVGAADRFPALLRPEAAPFVAAVLASLAEPPSPEM